VGWSKGKSGKQGNDLGLSQGDENGANGFRRKVYMYFFVEGSTA
jgi:hypothetical protein